MKRKRLTREESQKQTYERLLCAAQAVFIKKGFAASTIEDISRAAGHTRGAFYANFRDKRELLLALLKHEHEDMLAGLRSILPPNPSGDDLQKQAIAYYSRLYLKRDGLVLSIEAKLLAVRDARFRARFNLLIGERLERHAEYIRELSVLTGIPLSLPPMELGLGLTALCENVRLFHLLSPQTFTASQAEFLLNGFFSQAVLARREE
jgi:AcrR family transcriptional regulator